tara:strand:- start:8 stop:781 length:774 start_codon:yes stop_codon:yes gene_type:complete
MITEKYAQSTIIKGARMDGRAIDEFRNVEVEYGVSKKSAEGSARVKIGDTEVVAGVKLALGTPYSDKPNEGTIMVNVELIAMGSSKFEAGPPNIDAIELSRVTDRGIRECDAIDFKKLCVSPGEKVWMIYIDVYPINADGNLFDACGLAAMAALQDAVFPTITKDGQVDYYTKTKNKLSVKHTPLGCTVLKIANELIVDPLAEEESAASARLTVTFTEEGYICAMQKGGDGTLSAEDIAKMVEIASVKSAELRSHLK